MKFCSALLALATCLVVALAPPAQAQEKTQNEVPLVVKYQFLQLSDAEARKLQGERFITGKVSGRLLYEASLLTMTNRSGEYLAGEKWPVIYFDPRAEQFQVQYVDVGTKMDVQIKRANAGTYSLELRTEASKVNHVLAFERDVEAYPRTITHIFEENYPNLALDQTLILSQASGSGTRAFLEAEGLSQPGSNNVLCTIRLERP